MSPIRPSFFKSPKLAVPTINDDITSGTTIMIRRLMKASPMGLIRVAHSPISGPRIAPRTRPIKILLCSCMPVHQPNGPRDRGFFSLLASLFTRIFP